tara:strand:- start:1525 stop:2061 length:537 start_codon:yes stop_codon:yes gene_type:complete
MSQTTYRFKFNKELLDSIKEFSKLHSNDNCDDFLDAFHLWKRVNNEIISLEEKRILDLGFNGNIEEKIYKSARYYFKNKKNTTYKLNKQLKTNYIPRNPVFFKMMETYINKNPIKASLLYKEFINETDTHILSEINTEIVRLKTFELNQTECLQKIKKMFNNAYYKIKKQLKKQQLDV